MRQLGPYSKVRQLATLDPRTSEGLFVKRLREDLTEHLGHEPSAVERIYIDRACWLSLRIALLDKKIAAHQDFTLPDTNFYLAWNNSLVRLLARLGLESPKAKPSRPTLDEILAEAEAAE